jgi:RNA polymerase sigma factor (sigma-70 family)
MTVSEYNRCVDEFSNGLYRFVLKNINNTDAAKDIVQDVFEKFWEKRLGVTFEKAKSYLFSAAYHTMIDHIRKEKRYLSGAEDMENDYSHSEQYSDLQEILHEALNKLPPDQKSVILLRDYEGYSYEEIREITELNESQVKVYIYRARLFLKKYIGSMDAVI